MLSRIDPEVAKARMKPPKITILKQRKAWKKGISIVYVFYRPYLFPLLWLFDTFTKAKFLTPPNPQAPP